MSSASAVVCGSKLTTHHTMRMVRPSPLLACTVLGRRPRPDGRLPLSTLFSSSTEASHSSDDTNQPPPLLRLERARLRYPGSDTSVAPPFDLTIQHPSMGGHALLGRNGLGKTLLSNALASHTDDYLHEGSLHTDSMNWRPQHHVAHVSFESHEALLAQGGPAYHAISFGSNKLNKAAQFLVVRFGLFPLLHREVSTLSTGEIRKVLLVRALSKRPRLLILDNAFDGLDVPSRESLAELVSRTLKGFRPDILVQGVDARATAHTQVLLLTHRPEEIVDEIEAVTYLKREDKTTKQPSEVVTQSRNGRKGQELLASALGLDSENEWDLDLSCEDTSLPSANDVAAWWDRDRVSSQWQKTEAPLVQATDLCVKRTEAVLLQDLNWTVQGGERWLVAGGNGAGKSTLSRLLAKDEGGVASGKITVTTATQLESLSADDHRRAGVGWVSTELHMALARSSQTSREVLEGTASSREVAETVCMWMGLDDPGIRSRPFSALSQGEQKLVLLAASLASRPRLLVLDEPCQALDWVHRRTFLGLVERVCQSTDMGLIYITHHLEEALPSIGHVLHLRGGRAVYKGSRDAYDPRSLSKDEDDGLLT